MGSDGETEKNEAVNKYDEEDEKDDETRAAEERAAKEAAKKRCYKYTDEPKVYSDVKVSSESNLGCCSQLIVELPI